MTKISSVGTPPPIPDSTPSIPVSDIESKREGLLVAKHQLELQLNGVNNQLFLIDQLLNPKPAPAPNNTI
jgi:hypothetical protein